MGTLDTPSVIFEGVFVGLDKRDTKTGKSIVNGSIVDDTNSIKFIKFTNSPEEGDALLKQLKGLQRVRVQGSVSFDDRFDKVLYLIYSKHRGCGNYERGTYRKPTRLSCRASFTYQNE